jgi:2-polyprenyl-3-methyl-5-hydroxy-6-metoxy-1,4-benzoquinol methylase
LGKKYRQDQKLYYDGSYRSQLNKKKIQLELDSREFQTLPNKFKVNKNKNICDIGCGEGFLLNRFNKKNNVIGVDIDNKVIKKLRLKNFKVYKSVNEMLKNKKFHNYFDIIYCLKVIEHSDNPKKLINDALKMLKKNGKLILSTPNTNNILFNMLGAGYKSFFFRKHHNWYFDEKSLKKLIDSYELSSFKFYYIQYYPISNFLKWIKFKKFTKNILKIPKIFENELNYTWKKYLKKNKITEDILMELRK